VDQDHIDSSTLWLLLLLDSGPSGVLFRSRVKIVPGQHIRGCLVSELPVTDFYDWLMDQTGAVCGVRLYPSGLTAEGELSHVVSYGYVLKDLGGITVSFSGDSVDPDKSVWQCFGPNYLVRRRNAAAGVLIEAEDLATRFEGEPRILLRPLENDGDR
jgi:hypothetical protein